MRISRALITSAQCNVLVSESYQRWMSRPYCETLNFGRGTTRSRAASDTMPGAQTFEQQSLEIPCTLVIGSLRSVRGYPQTTPQAWRFARKEKQLLFSREQEESNQAHYLASLSAECARTCDQQPATGGTAPTWATVGVRRACIFLCISLAVLWSYNSKSESTGSISRIAKTGKNTRNS